MRVVAVESSTLAAVGYDASGQVLQLEFCSRDVYHYVDVPATVHRALLSAESRWAMQSRVVRRRNSKRSNWRTMKGFRTWKLRHG